MKKFIYICQEEDHNKFWSVEVDDKTFTVNIEYGRLGTDGRREPKSFSALHDATAYANNKTHEKKRKGYVLIDDNKFNRMQAIAKAIGVKNKIDRMEWYKHDNGRVVAKASDLDMHNPDLQLGILVDITLNKPINGIGVFRFLIGYDKIYMHSTSHGNVTVNSIDKSSPYYQVVGKVEDAVSAFMQ